MQKQKKQKRGIRDVFCSCIFFVVVIGYIVVGCLAFTYGDPKTLISPPLQQLEDEIYAFDIEEFEILRKDIWWVIGAAAFSIGLSIVWFFLIKHMTAFMIYISSTVAALMVAVLGFYLYSVSLQLHSFELTLLAVVCWIVSVLIFVLLLAFREKILFTSELVKHSGRILQSNTAVILLAVLVAMIYLAIVLLSILIIVHLYSVPLGDDPSTLPITISGDYIIVYDSRMRNLSWFIFFASLWISETLFALETYVIAFVASHKINVAARTEVERKNPITDGVATAMVYNLGTLAFAGFVKATLSFLSVFAKHVNKEKKNPNSCFSSYLFKVFKILVDSVAEFAVIFSSMHNGGFVGSAKAVAKLLKSELGKVVISKVIVHYIFITGQLLAAAFVTVIACFIVVETHGHLGAFVVASIFIPVYFIFGTVSTVYTAVVNTVLLILLIDKGNPEQRLPESLYKYIDTSAIEI